MENTWELTVSYDNTRANEATYIVFISINIFAARDIAAGEELVSSYHEFTEADSYHERQRQLKSQYMFDCACAKCLREKPAPAARRAKK